MLLRQIYTNPHVMKKTIKSAGCLIIGDEILNGKISDTNSYNFAKYCFNNLSIPLKKTIVCGDDRDEIIESINILQKKCDLIVTSGGIGPTHDDITYEALGAAFKLPCKLDREIVARMSKLRSEYLDTLSKAQKDAFFRMATIPESSDPQFLVEKLFVDDSLWVPIVGINGSVYILPGVPKLFDRLLKGLGDHLKPRVEGTGLKRYYVKTKTKESELAPFLLKLQLSVNQQFSNNVKLGSYPHMEWQTNTVSIIGTDAVSDSALREIVSEVIHHLKGDAVEISQEEEEFYTRDAHAKER